jgi:hypothetical protein
MITYEERLSRDVWGALREGSMHFEKESAVHKTLAALTKRLDELKIPYALVGAMALFYLSDVQEVIRVLGLPRAFAEQLDSYVRDKYRELWDAVRNNPAEP